jgi:mRNA interferase RelE/StbE
MMQVLIAKSAVKALRKMQPEKAKDIREAISRMARDPAAPNNNVKALKGIKDGYRIRVGDWRVSYVSDRVSQTLKVFEIAPRGGAYR